MKPAALANYHRRSPLTKRQVRELSNYVNPGVILDLMRKHHWNIEKGIAVLAQIATNSLSETNRMAAIRELNKLISDALTVSGLVVNVTQVVNPAAGHGAVVVPETTFKTTTIMSNLPEAHRRFVPSSEPAGVIQEKSNGRNTSPETVEIAPSGPPETAGDASNLGATSGLPHTPIRDHPGASDNDTTGSTSHIHKRPRSGATEHFPGLAPNPVDADAGGIG